MISQVLYPYEGRTDVTLTALLWEDSGEMLRGRKRPAVLVCPGGAYVSCSDREADPVALAFAAMGYHAFVLRYAVYSWDGRWPGLDQPYNGNPNSRFPAPMRDIGKAFLTVRSHADEWLVDTDRIAVCGFSAGGHNAAMYSCYWHSPYLTEHFGQPAEAFRPAAAILGYPVISYRRMEEQLGTLNDGARYVHLMECRAFLGERPYTPELLRAVSADEQVTDRNPPTFLWHTAADDLVPVWHSLSMAAALAAHGVPFEAHIFEDGPHGLSTATQSSASSQDYLNPAAAAWVPLAGRWLEKRFAIDFPEHTVFD